MELEKPPGFPDSGDCRPGLFLNRRGGGGGRSILYSICRRRSINRTESCLSSATNKQRQMMSSQSAGTDGEKSSSLQVPEEDGDDMSAMHRKRHLSPTTTSAEAIEQTEPSMAPPPMPFPATVKLDLLQKKRKTQEVPWELPAMADDEVIESGCAPASIPFSWEQEPGKPWKLSRDLPCPHSTSNLPLPPRLLLPPPASSSSPNSSTHRKNAPSWHNLLIPLGHHRRSSDASAPNTPAVPSPSAAAESKLRDDVERTDPTSAPVKTIVVDIGDAPPPGKANRLNPLVKLFSLGRSRQQQQNEEEHASSSCLRINLFRRNDRVSGMRSPCLSPEAEESTGFLPDHAGKEASQTDACPNRESKNKNKNRRRGKNRRSMSRKQSTQKQEDGGGGYGFLLRKGSRVMIAAYKAMKRRTVRLQRGGPWRLMMEYQTLGA